MRVRVTLHGWLKVGVDDPDGLIELALPDGTDVAGVIEALREKRIAGAALDVYAKEPPDEDSPLLRMDNVALTPHMASFTDEGRYRMGVTVARQVLEVLQGKRPQFLADPSVWDRRRILSDKRQNT